MSDWWGGAVDRPLVCSRSALVEVSAVLPATGKIVVARLDAARMPDADHVFYEFSDALLFPGYFGWSWAALSDCLQDLNWLPADGYLVVVDNGSLLLSNSVQDRHMLLRILSHAVQHWANPLGRPGGRGIPFRVLLLCDRDEDAASLRQDIAGAVHDAR